MSTMSFQERMTEKAKRNRYFAELEQRARESQIGGRRGGPPPKPTPQECRCGCGRKLVADDKSGTVPPGFHRHGGRGLAKVCYNRLVKAGELDRVAPR